MASIVSAGTTSGTALNMSGDTSGVLQLASNNGTTAVTIDTSQNVGVGVTPSAWRTLYGTKVIQFGPVSHVAGLSASATNNRTSVGCNFYTNSSSNQIYMNSDYATEYQQTNGSHIFFIAPSGTSGGTASFTQAMTLDSSGNLLVGRTSAWTTNTSDNTTGFGVLASNGQTLVNATGGVNALIVNNTNSANRVLSVRYANTEVGGITTTTSTATFNGTSDARLKEDLGVSTDTSVIDNTIIHDFKWTRDGTQGKGVFAQEAYEVYPLAISKGSDELNESGNLANPWQVNYSQYIPDLIVYCQKLKKTIDTQAETINALTARVVALESK
jgi:hypothetical protein